MDQRAGAMKCKVLIYYNLYSIYNQFYPDMGKYTPICAERCTGSKIHVLEKNGQKELQSQQLYFL